MIHANMNQRATQHFTPGPLTSNYVIRHSVKSMAIYANSKKTTYSAGNVSDS